MPQNILQEPKVVSLHRPTAPITPAAEAAGTARLRVTLSAGHSSMEVAKLIAALNALERDLK